MPPEQKDAPKPRFCLVCEEVVISTEKEFIAKGHSNNTEHAAKKYAFTQGMATRVISRLRSGAYGREASVLEIREPA